MTAWRAIIAGQLVVNVPVVALFYGMSTLLQGLLPAGQVSEWVRLLAAFSLSMAWGIYSSRRWRRWALRKGVSEVELHRLAGLTLLMMPRASTPRAPTAPPRKPKKK